MRVIRYVIHELVKEARSTEAYTKVSTRLGEVDEFAKTLVEQIHDSFSHSTSLKNTDFADRNDSTFKINFERYYEANDDRSFYDFSLLSIRKLENDIQNENLAKGGFYLYADYEVNGNRFVTVVLLRKRDGLNVELIDGVFRPNTAENLNIDKLAMGFRFNSTIFDNEDDERYYIALIATQSDKVSNYFKDWVAVAEMFSDKANTNSFLSIVNQIPIPLDGNGNATMRRDEFRSEVHAFVKASRRNVNLKTLGLAFFGENGENEFISFASERDIQIDNEFKGNINILRRLVSIDAKVDGIELKVKFEKLNSNDVDINDNSIVIRNSELIAQVIRQRDES